MDETELKKCIFRSTFASRPVWNELNAQVRQQFHFNPLISNRAWTRVRGGVANQVPAQLLEDLQNKT